MKPPIAKQVPHLHMLHGDTRPDHYDWLKDRNNPDVIHYIKAENQYYEDTMQPLTPLTDLIYQKMVDRVPEVETQVPVQNGIYYYYSRMEKSLEYPVYARKRAANRQDLVHAQEEIVLNQNLLAEQGQYLSVTEQRITADHVHLAYLVNRDGSDRYTGHIKSITTGNALPDLIPDVYIWDSIEWDESGQYLFYITVDENQRPNRLYRHQIGDTNLDTLIYEETDITFYLRLFKSRNGRFLFLKSESTTTDEIRYLKSDEALGAWHIISPRQKGIRYTVEHWDNDFLILTNESAKNFRLLHCPCENPDIALSHELIPYDDVRYLEHVYPFRDALLIEGRQDGLTQLWLYKDCNLERIPFDEPVYTVSVGDNRDFATHEALIQFESLLTPKTTYSINLQSGERTRLQVAQVSGDYDPSRYRQERLWAIAEDGTKIPLFSVYRIDALNDGPAPLILSAYGSYGYSSDPSFDAMRLPLLDMGVIFTTAQIRGGSEMGHAWYEDGKLLKKRNTFTDFISSAAYLIEHHYTTPDKLAARGGSAGGLLMGAVANLAGHLFQAMVAQVPFVDVVTTMLDATLPLTSLEWDEWGNPENPEHYAYMKSYSPYDNVEKKDYPHLLVTTGMNDPRVSYWEPAKWVAKLREFKTDKHVLLLKTNMGSGHFGSSGRFSHLREMAGIYAFVIDKIGFSRN